MQPCWLVFVFLSFSFLFACFWKRIAISCLALEIKKLEDSMERSPADGKLGFTWLLSCSSWASYLPPWILIFLICEMTQGRQGRVVGLMSLDTLWYLFFKLSWNTLSCFLFLFNYHDPLACEQLEVVWGLEVDSKKRYHNDRFSRETKQTVQDILLVCHFFPFSFSILESWLPKCLELGQYIDGKCQYLLRLNVCCLQPSQT